MRPRLILSLEQQIQKNIDDPTFVYEALKVYLMLGGKAPSVDKNLILVVVHARLGGTRLSGRALCSRTRAAARASPGHARHGRRASAESLARTARSSSRRRPRSRACGVAERAYTLLKSEAHNDGVEDWIASQRGGPDMALVFEAANGANLDTIRVPGFFTYDGFYGLAPRPYADDRRQAAEGELGARRPPANRTPSSSST